MTDEDDGKCVWFKKETNLVMMINLLEIMTEELEKQPAISWAKCEGEAGSQSSEEALDKGACFVLQRTLGGERG